MGYCVDFDGDITLRNGVTEEDFLKGIRKDYEYSSHICSCICGSTEITEALEIIFGGSATENSAVSFSFWGNTKYRDGDWDKLAKYFDGQVDFIGEDGGHWTSHLKDGMTHDVRPIEIVPNIGESPEDAVARWLKEHQKEDEEEEMDV